MACRLRLKFGLTDVAAMLWYGDGAGNAAEENSLQPDFIYLAALRLDKMTMTYK